MNNKSRILTQGAIIAALYAVLTHAQNLLLPGSATWAIQMRLSEALCVLPVFTTAAIPGVTVGCFLANLLTGGTVWDLTIGVLATLIGVLAAWIGRRWKYLSSLPTILSNTILIPWVLILAGFIPAGAVSYWVTALTVGLGEVIACGIFGTVLVRYLDKHPNIQRKLFK